MTYILRVWTVIAVRATIEVGGFELSNRQSFQLEGIKTLDRKLQFIYLLTFKEIVENKTFLNHGDLMSFRFFEKHPSCTCTKTVWNYTRQLLEKGPLVACFEQKQIHVNVL